MLVKFGRESVVYTGRLLAALFACCSCHLRVSQRQASCGDSLLIDNCPSRQINNVDLTQCTAQSYAARLAEFAVPVKGQSI